MKFSSIPYVLGFDIPMDCSIGMHNLQGGSNLLDIVDGVKIAIVVNPYYPDTPEGDRRYSIALFPIRECVSLRHNFI